MYTKDDILNYLKDEDCQNQIETDRRPYLDKIKEINILLGMNGFTELGDLFDTSLFSVHKTLNVIKLLLDDRLKILDSKGELYKKISKSEADYINLIEKSESNCVKINELNNKISSMRNKISNDEKRFKEELEKIKSEKNDQEKIINRLIMKESQYKHEIRKLEKEIEEYKNKLKKIMCNEKDQNLNLSKPANMNSNNICYNLSSNLKSSNILGKSSTSLKANLSNFEFSQNIQMPVTLNSIIPDNESKNSNKNVENIDHLKEFYNLVFNSMNEKINHLILQNSDMKQCYKLIHDELNQFMEYKKLFLYKHAKDSIENIKGNQSMINFDLFELDFNVCRDSVLQNFNDILNAFRFMIVYEILKIDPATEFDFDEVKNILSNKKFVLEEIPYYSEIKRKIESFNFNKLNKLKDELKISLNSVTIQESESKHRCSIPNDEMMNVLGKTEKSPSQGLPRSSKLKNQKNQMSLIEYNELDNLEETNKNLEMAINSLDDRFFHLENEINKSNEIILKGK